MLVSLVGLVTIISTAGFFLARSYQSDTWIAIMTPALKYSLYTIVGCCAYAGLVGLYHTVLSVTGLDESKGSAKRRHEEAIAASRQNEP
jgi:hypothetical protein